MKMDIDNDTLMDIYAFADYFAGKISESITKGMLDFHYIVKEEKRVERIEAIKKEQEDRKQKIEDMNKRFEESKK